MARSGAYVGLNQVAVQALGFVSAVLVVRLLPTGEYALYTLATSFLATTVVLADGGVATGVMAEGGKVWNRRAQLADAVATGIALRRMFAPWAALLCAPAMLWMLRRHGADWPDCLAITGLMLVAFVASLSSGVLEVPLKLRQELHTLQRIQLGTALLRACLVAAMVLALSWATLALAANALAQAWTVHRLRRAQARAGDGPGAVDPRMRAAVLRVVRLTLPGVVYYSLSGQLTVWLVSIFGSTSAIAEVGALGRLAAVLAVVTSLLSILVAPRFARLENRRTVLMRNYLLVLAAVAGFSAFVCLLVWRFPDPMLSILGPQYRALHTEAMLMAASSCLGLVASSMGSLAASRALLLRPIVAIPFGMVSTAAAIAFADLTTAVGVLTMSTFISAFSALFATASGAWLIRRHAQ
jgi:O-antigen/teichoic acid export membrane protein